MTVRRSARFKLVFDTRDKVVGGVWPAEADALLQANEDLQELLEAAAALNQLQRPVFTLS